MAQYDRRLGDLYQLLDENNLEWLTSEVRAFAKEVPEASLSMDEVSALRFQNLKSNDVAAQRNNENVEASSQSKQLPQEFEACVRYVGKRLEALANYLEGAAAHAEFLGITSIRLDLETEGETDHTELSRLLRELGSLFNDLRTE